MIYDGDSFSAVRAGVRRFLETLPWQYRGKSIEQTLLERLARVMNGHFRSRLVFLLKQHGLPPLVSPDSFIDFMVGDGTFSEVQASVILRSDICSRDNEGSTLFSTAHGEIPLTETIGEMFQEIPRRMDALAAPDLFKAVLESYDLAQDIEPASRKLWELFLSQGLLLPEGLEFSGNFIFGPIPRLFFDAEQVRRQGEYDGVRLNEELKPLDGLVFSPTFHAIFEMPVSGQSYMGIARVLRKLSGEDFFRLHCFLRLKVADSHSISREDLEKFSHFVTGKYPLCSGVTILAEGWEGDERTFKQLSELLPRRCSLTLVYSGSSEPPAVLGAIQIVRSGSNARLVLKSADVFDRFLKHGSSEDDASFMVARVLEAKNCQASAPLPDALSSMSCPIHRGWKALDLSILLDGSIKSRANGPSGSCF